MADEKRLIDANALKNHINALSPHWLAEWSTIGVLAEVDKAPTVDAVEVVHGRYEMGIDEGDYEYGTCSVCGYNEYNAFGCCLPHNYCPNCGAKMDGRSDIDGE